MFRIDAGSGVPIYRQLVEQVRREIMLGRLSAGTQLPTLREVVQGLAINPNTVVKAYTELEHEGLIVRRQGTGTFVSSNLPDHYKMAPQALTESLMRWVRRAREAGLTNEQMRMVMSAALDDGAGARAAAEGSAA